MTSKINSYLQVICALFIFLFCYTAVSKLQEFDRFKFVLSKSPIIANYSTLLAIALPVVELAVVALLTIPVVRRWGLYSSLVLMIIFTCYIGYMVLFTPHLPCSCGGVIRQMTWKQHFVFNLFFIALAFLAIVMDRRYPKPAKQKGNISYLDERC
jgi:uncharacterized membrane protein YjfL (UPF0719 family)